MAQQQVLDGSPSATANLADDCGKKKGTENRALADLDQNLQSIMTGKGKSSSSSTKEPSTREPSESRTMPTAQQQPTTQVMQPQQQQQLQPAPLLETQPQPVLPQPQPTDKVLQSQSQQPQPLPDQQPPSASPMPGASPSRTNRFSIKPVSDLAPVADGTSARPADLTLAEGSGSKLTHMNAHMCQSVPP